MSINDVVKTQILTYEKMLQCPSDYPISELACLLADDFIEFGQSGKIWRKDDVVQYFLKVHQANNNEIVMRDEHFHYTNDNIILLTYQAEKIEHSAKVSQQSLRSSLWKNNNGRWIMLFHQGTPAEATNL